MEGLFILLLAAQSFYFMLPAYIANMSPVLAKGILKPLAKPIDLGLRLRGKPLLGSHKTFRGLIIALLTGILVFKAQQVIYQEGLLQLLVMPGHASLLSDYLYLPGLLLALGAMFGDALESLFKRQFSIKPGRSWIPFDQIDFIIGALLFLSLIYVPSWQVIVILLVLTPLVHIGANHLGYYLKIKKEKW